MIRVLATGTFDILHPGHVLYLERAKSLGDELYVIVARSSMVKHKPKPLIPEEQRLKMVASLKMVDVAILGSEHNMFEPLLKIKPDIIALGPNQHFKEAELEAKLRELGFKSKVVRIKEFDTCNFCSSAAIIKHVKETER